MPIVVVAGTKGKGSTAAMLASILAASGTRTGLYTQPHLQSYRERVRVDGRAIGGRAFAAAAGELRSAVAALPRHLAGASTTFEIVTALALLHFARRGCGAAVLEVGLGGRADATNAVDPLVSVVTSISHDHTAVLGRRLSSIAREKAGIARPGRVLVSATQPPAAAAAIAAACARTGAALRVMPPLAPRDPLARGLALAGAHQLQNAALAVAAARALAEHGLATGDGAIRHGLARLRWPGRYEVLTGAPTIVLDGAHNDGSARALAATLRHDLAGHASLRSAEQGPLPRLGLVVGMLADKDVRAFARELRPLAAAVYATAPRSARALDADELATRFGGRATRAFPHLAEALAAARADASPRDVICVSGSLALVGEARDLLGLAVAERLWDEAE